MSGDIAVDVGTFSAKHTLHPGLVEIVFKGEGDAAALAAIDKYLKDIHEIAVASKVAEVILDLRSVTFMSSSALTKLISWVTRVSDGDDDSRYRIRLRSDPQMLWQRRSLHALQCFAVDLITIETEGMS